MKKLTENGQPGGLIRFVSKAERYDLVQKLGTIEHQSERLINRACDHICRFPGEADPDELQGLCEECPVNKLAELIGV